MLNQRSDQRLEVSPHFDVSDFQGTTKYKIIAPLLLLASWICMFAGPSLFPVQYQIFTLMVFVFFLYKFSGILATMIYITYKTRGIFKGDLDSQQQYQQFEDKEQIVPEINYGFILPNYKEDLELLSETLEILASHKRAKSQYLIFLAMEAHETDSEQKAFRLIESFKKYFKIIDFTRHDIRQYEQKGKASNVSWCVEHLQPYFEKYLINPDSVMLTILDADSWAPDLYFDLLEAELLKETPNNYKYNIYTPTQIFTRNNLDVPVLTRVLDNFHAFLHISSLFSCSNLTFPLSNYSLSYSLAKQISYWDTCSDAIAQDFHTVAKAYWKTNGKAKAVPIYVPFNQSNIETGKGYWQNIKARFWQSERHSKSVAEISYAFNMFLKTPFKLKNIHMMMLVLELFAFVAIAPWVIYSLGFQKLFYLYHKPSPEMLADQFVQGIFSIANLLMGVAYLLYQIYRRRANKSIYKQQNESILRMLEFYILIGIIFTFIIIPGYIIASFLTLFGHAEYIVAEKKISSKK